MDSIIAFGFSSPTPVHCEHPTHALEAYISVEQQRLLLEFTNRIIARNSFSLCGSEFEAMNGLKDLDWEIRTGYVGSEVEVEPNAESMHRSLTLTGCVAVILFGGVLQAQAQFTVNAAADDAVPGWQKMEIEGRAVWVNPTPALTSADIQGAQPATEPNYGNFVKVSFTAAGARKMRES
jgi:hypothetical protein